MMKNGAGENLPPGTEREDATCPACGCKEYMGFGKCPECRWSIPELKIRKEPQPQGYTAYYCRHCGDKLGVERCLPDPCESCFISRGL